MFNPAVVVHLLAQEYPPAADRTPSRDELKIFGHLRRLLADRDLDVEELEEDLGTERMAQSVSAKTERMAQSVSASTHPFTIMPVHVLDGRLGKKLFVQLKETGGHFPRTITPYQADNLHIVAGTSHMMTKQTMLEFFKECVIPEIPSSALVVVDSWSSFKDHKAIEDLVPPGKTLEVRNIPAGATSKIQPCDVFFFRFMKTMYRRFHDHVLIYDLDFELQKRDNILKLISAIYRIFSNGRFVDFLQYAWYRAGYSDTRGPRFQTPVEYSFPSAMPPCQEPGCTEKIAFVRCPECEKFFCFNHFLMPTPDKIHWC